MSMISVPKSDIEMIFNLLGEKLSNSSGSSTVKLNKSGKPKKQNSNKGKPTCHGDFVKMICEKFKDDVATFKAENPEQKGAHLVFAANYKKEHAEEFTAFETEWKEAHPKDAVSDAGSVVASENASSDGSEKKKRAPMSDEQKAKMKAGREAAKAKKDAEKAAPVATDTPVAETEAAPVAEAKPAAKKPVKSAKKATPAITTPVAAPIEAAAPELLPFKMGVVTYLRMGTKRPDGNHLWASGHIWNSTKGAKGPYVGELQDDGELNEEATEPAV